MPKPDLIVKGSVAVDISGYRLGKGHGYGDLEIVTIKKMFGDIPIATSVHDMQVVKRVPSEEKDEKVTIIITQQGSFVFEDTLCSIPVFNGSQRVRRLKQVRVSLLHSS